MFSIFGAPGSQNWKYTASISATLELENYAKLKLIYRFVM